MINIRILIVLLSSLFICACITKNNIHNYKHETIDAIYQGEFYRYCGGKTAFCPDRCGGSYNYARFTSSDSTYEFNYRMKINDSNQIIIQDIEIGNYVTLFFPIDQLLQPSSLIYLEKMNLIEISDSDEIFDSWAVEKLPKERPGQEVRIFIVYPDDAREAGIEGRVVIEAVIGKNGKIETARVSGRTAPAFPSLDEAALNAVYKSIWTPAMQDGKKVRVKIIIPIEFKLSL